MTANPIDIQLSQESKLLLEKLYKHAGALSLINSFKVIGISYRKEVKGIFEQKQTRDASLRWPDITIQTDQDKTRKGFGGQPILVRTEKLKKSMTQTGGQNINEYGHDFAFYGSEVPYGIYHDNTDAPRTKLPLRNFSLPSVSTYGGWLNTISSDILNQLKKMGIK